jgi:hypothetical protein
LTYSYLIVMALVVCLGAVGADGFPMLAGQEGKTGRSRDSEGPVNRQGEAAGNAAIDSVPAAPFCDDQTGGKWGFIDRHGNVVLRPRYDYAGDFIDGLALVGWRGERLCIDRSGTIQFTVPAEMRKVRNATHRRVWVMDAKERWGLLDDRGHVVLVPQYDMVEEFSDGLAKVNLGAKDVGIGDKFGGKWGYVDSQGKRIIPVQYEFAGPFRDGLARVTDGGGQKFIDHSGKVAIDVSSWAEGGFAHDFHDGLAAVVFLEGKHTKFVDRMGQIELRVNGYSYDFQESMAAFHVEVTQNGTPRDRYGFVNKKGELIVKPVFESAHSFSDGLAAVCTLKHAGSDRAGDKWGFIDKSGKFVIAPSFNVAHSLKNGVAMVHVGGAFANVPHFSHWVGGEWWLIDSNGKKLKSWATRRPQLP